MSLQTSGIGQTLHYVFCIFNLEVSIINFKRRKQISGGHVVIRQQCENIVEGIMHFTTLEYSVSFSIVVKSANVYRCKLCMAQPEIHFHNENTNLNSIHWH